ncbi:MAG: radical SAM family heme chaperone HemW [Desulfobaccales bacterium]
MALSNNKGGLGRLQTEFLATTAAPGGLYIHVPFCRRKCPYCDFASGTDLSLIPDWLAAVGREMQLCQCPSLHFDTIYFGGGTPSLLAAPEIAALMEGLGENFIISPNPEITLEANPDDLTPDLLRDYRQVGLNRLSLGVQSLSDRELAWLGRRHDAAQARRAILWARQAGFDNLGIDLMYGLPGQTLQTWRKTLDSVLNFEPEHVSCYQLTLEDGTPLARRRAAGQFPTLAEEEEREFFLFTSQFLEDRGYVHYEISNFARGLKYLSRHNGKYWNHSPYLGLGPAAHSFLNGRRWWNHRSLEAYCQALKTGRTPVAGEEVLSPEQLRLEALFLGLRTKDGVNINQVLEVESRKRVLQELVNAGLVELKGNRLLPTRLGFLVADRLSLFLYKPD